MSIYGTWLSIDDESHELSCARWRRATKDEAQASEIGYAVDIRDRYWLPVLDAACTCGEQAPIVYQGSHVNPGDDDKRGGFVMVCAIPDHCHPNARGDDEGEPVNFLRLSVREDPTTYHGGEPGDATVVLTRKQVAAIHETLTAWLESHPVTGGSEPVAADATHQNSPYLTGGNA